MTFNSQLDWFSEGNIGSGYCVLMNEIKARIETAYEFVNQIKETDDVVLYRRNIFLFEGCYLQLRKICELLGLAVLLAQNFKTSVSSSIIKEWRSDRIFDYVSKINPEGFPRPVDLSERNPSENIAMLSDMPPVFTGNELKTLYIKCGDLMHVGHLKNIIRSHIRELDQKFIQDWCMKFVLGLRMHIVRLPNSNQCLFVHIDGNEGQGATARFVTKL